MYPIQFEFLRDFFLLCGLVYYIRVLRFLTFFCGSQTKVCSKHQKINSQQTSNTSQNYKQNFSLQNLQGYVGKNSSEMRAGMLKL